MKYHTQIALMNECCKLAEKYSIPYTCSLAGMKVGGKLFPLASVQDAKQWIMSMVENPGCPQSTLDFF